MEPFQKRNLLTLLGMVGMGVVFGYVWPIVFRGLTPCLFYNVTGWPCAGCGMSRAFNQMMQGNFTNAMIFNPLIYPVLLLAATMALTLIYDMLMGKDKLYPRFFLRPPFKEKWKNILCVILLILLVMGHWAFNIYKHIIGII